jgi:outer membrane protein assembly factor BamB
MPSDVRRAEARRLTVLLLLLALTGCRLERHTAKWTVKAPTPFGGRFAVVGDGVVLPHHSDERADVLSCFALADGRLRWQVPLENFQVGSALSGVLPIADPDGASIYVAQGSNLARFSMTDGALRWDTQVPPKEPFESFTIGHSPVVMGQRLYLLSRSARVVAVDRGTGAMLFRTHDTESATDLAVRAGTVITRSLEQSDVRAHDAQTGAPLWQRAMSAPFPITTRLETSLRLAPDNGLYFVLDGQRALLALDPRTGAVRWEQPIQGLASYAMAGTVVVLTDSASVRGLDATNGSVRWRHPTGGLSVVAPLDDTTALLALSTRMCTVDAASGTLRRHGRHRLHEQDGVLDARGGLVVMTTDGVARLFRRDGDDLADVRIGESLPRLGDQARHGLRQATIAAKGAVTFNTANEIERYGR